MRSIFTRDHPMGSRSFRQKSGNGGDTFLRHLGIYGYRAGFIRRYVNWQPSPLEHIEMLEQLRVLWYGEKFTLPSQKKSRVPA